jgi:uncharacterized protein YdhG (YjbR/CyaY superfamily)
MKPQRSSPATIDEYIAGFSEEVQVILRQMRRVIRKAAPEAEEAIKYQMPTFVLHENIVLFAAFQKHVGFYPAPSAVAHFKDELAVYRSAKGSVQFPLDQPIPIALIERMVAFRVDEAKARQKAIKKRR